MTFGDVLRVSSFCVLLRIALLLYDIRDSLPLYRERMEREMHEQRKHEEWLRRFES